VHAAVLSLLRGPRWWRPSGLFLRDVLSLDPEGTATVGTLRLARGRIAAIDGRAERGDQVVDLGGALVLPGLVNAHDHLELNNFSRLKYRDVHGSSYEWAADMKPRLDTDPAVLAARATPIGDRLFLGGMKNLLAGVTTVCHHNPLYRPLRQRWFPVKVVRRYGWAHSPGLEPAFALSYRRTPRAAPWIIHLAEGTDDVAAHELDALARAGALADNTVIVHGVGLTDDDRKRVAAAGAALIWCPSSNRFLLYRTARVAELASARRLAIGSDSRLTGARDLLDELACARAEAQIDAVALLRAVTIDAARILRLDGAGRITPGAPADLVIFPPPPPDGDPLETLGKVRRAAIRAVIIDGRIRIADPDLAPLVPGGVPVMVDGAPKILAGDLAARHARGSLREPGLEIAADEGRRE
jgi:cytosine/adenosine deaminase-related metal-dependent hydrolase